jgi:hypothetical protein
MRYSSRFDWCVFAGILVTVAAILLGGSYWISGPVLLILLLSAYPKSYETTAAALVVHDVLARRTIPYRVITFARAERGRVKIRYGLASELVLTPSDSAALLADMESHARHLVRRGDELMLRDRHVEYSFTKPRRIYGVG